MKTALFFISTTFLTVASAPTSPTHLLPSTRACSRYSRFRPFGFKFRYPNF